MKCYYCSLLKKDTIFGIVLTECCKKHDNDTGMNGSFNFLRHAIDFYNCLLLKGLKKYQALLITLIATLGVFIRLPYFIYKKLKQRRTL